AALTVATASKFLREEGQARYELGLDLAAAGDRMAAELDLQASLRLARDVRDHEGEAGSLVALARLDRDAGRLAAARARLEDGVGIIESLRATAPDDLARAGFL